jgi:tRNA G46 methylase TrmB
MLLKYYQKLDDAISYLFSSTANEKKLLKKIFNNKQLIVIDIGANQGNFIGFLKNNFILKKI